MKKNFFFLIVIGLFVFSNSCTVPEEKSCSRPDTLLSMNDMQEMMVGICRLEAQLRVFRNEDMESQEKWNTYGKQQLDTLLQQHQITWNTWKTNFNYYMTQKALSDTLMKRVTAKFTEEEVIQSETLRKTLDTNKKLIVPEDAVWEEVIEF